MLIASAIRPALPQNRESAMEKHAACAAPMSSSGVLPSPASNREANEYSPSIVPALNDPLPSLRPPRHTALCLLLDHGSVPFSSRNDPAVATIVHPLPAAFPQTLPRVGGLPDSARPAATRVTVGATHAASFSPRGVVASIGVDEHGAYRRPMRTRQTSGPSTSYVQSKASGRAAVNWRCSGRGS